MLVTSAPDAAVRIEKMKLSIRAKSPNVQDQRPRATDIRLGTETQSQGSLHPACSRLAVNIVFVTLWLGQLKPGVTHRGNRGTNIRVNILHVVGIHILSDK